MIMTNREIWRDRLMGRRRARGSGGRIPKARAHHVPTARIFDFPAERTGFGSRRERCCPGLAGRAETRDLRAKRPSPPRCREANGGVAVVAADAAMNRNGGHHAEFEHP